MTHDTGIKKYLHRLPEMHIDVHRRGFHDTALVFSLFYAFNTLDRFVPPHIFNTATACAKSLIANTKHNYDLVFFVENALWDNYADVMLRHGITPESIVFFDAPESDIKRNRISKMMYPLCSPELMEYKRLLLWDVDMFGCSMGGQYDFSECTLWDSNKISMLHWNPKEMTGYDQKPHWWAKFEHMAGVDEKRTILSRMSEMSGLYHLSHQFPSMAGGVRYIPTEHVDPKFIKFFEKCEPELGDDENICYLWWLMTGYEYNDIVVNWQQQGVPICFTREDWRWTQEGNYFNNHEVYIDREEFPEWFVGQYYEYEKYGIIPEPEGNFFERRRKFKQQLDRVGAGSMEDDGKMELVQQGDFYFSHIYNDDDEDREWEQTFHKQAGLI